MRFADLRPTWQRYRALLVILTVSLLLRIVLVFNGGQMYWPDEDRYYRAFQLLERLAAGDLKGSIESILVPAVHSGFVLIAALPATIHALLYLLVPGFHLNDTLWLPAFCLSLFSVANIGLVYALARRAGAGSREALLAAFLMACTTSMLYFARHLLPYDASLTLVLLAVWIGLYHPSSAKRSLMVGIVTSLAVLTYNGYWVSGLCAMALHFIIGPRNWTTC